MNPRAQPTLDAVSRHVERRLMLIIAAALAVGLLLSLAGWQDQGPLVPAALVLLIGMPFVSLVLGALRQARRGEWPFVAIAAVTLALLCFSVLRFIDRL